VIGTPSTIDIQSWSEQIPQSSPPANAIHPSGNGLSPLFGSNRKTEVQYADLILFLFNCHWILRFSDILFVHVYL